MPLYTISGACQKMVESEELKKFELAIGNNKISLQMGQMQTHCQLVMLRLDDMQDLVRMIDGRFKKRTNFFNMSKTYSKIKQMMQIKASIKNVDLQCKTLVLGDLWAQT